MGNSQSTRQDFNHPTVMNMSPSWTGVMVRNTRRDASTSSDESQSTVEVFANLSSSHGTNQTDTGQRVYTRERNVIRLSAPNPADLVLQRPLDSSGFSSGVEVNGSCFLHERGFTNPHQNFQQPNISMGFQVNETNSHDYSSIGFEPQEQLSSSGSLSLQNDVLYNNGTATPLRNDIFTSINSNIPENDENFKSQPLSSTQSARHLNAVTRTNQLVDQNFHKPNSKVPQEEDENCSRASHIQRAPDTPFGLQNSKNNNPISLENLHRHGDTEIFEPRLSHDFTQEETMNTQTMDSLHYNNSRQTQHQINSLTDQHNYEHSVQNSIAASRYNDIHKKEFLDKNDNFLQKSNPNANMCNSKNKYYNTCTLNSEALVKHRRFDSPNARQINDVSINNKILPQTPVNQYNSNLSGNEIKISNDWLRNIPEQSFQSTNVKKKYGAPEIIFDKSPKKEVETRPNNSTPSTSNRVNCSNKGESSTNTKVSTCNSILGIDTTDVTDTTRVMTTETGQSKEKAVVLDQKEALRRLQDKPDDWLVTDDKINRKSKFLAYLCMAEEDEETFGLPFLMSLESNFGPIFAQKRDLVIHGPKFENMARIVEERCKGKVIIILSKNLSKSEECSFITQFAKQLDPDARKRNLIPLQIDKDVELPNVLKGLSIIDYNRAYKFGWLKKKLIDALEIKEH